MNFNAINDLSAKEVEQFKAICNYLLSHTFMVRTIFNPEKGRINNPDYIFLSIHYETVREYLSLLDWDLRKDDYNGYYYILNTNEVNRRSLNKATTAILLALRLIYEENQGLVGLDNDVICTVGDALDKIVVDYAILSARPNMDEVKRCFRLLENHNVIQRIDGKFNQNSCKFAILPTVLTAVSSERLEAVVSAMRKAEEKEEDIEETDEDTAD